MKIEIDYGAQNVIVTSHNHCQHISLSEDQMIQIHQIIFGVPMDPDYEMVYDPSTEEAEVKPKKKTYKDYIPFL